MRSLSIVLFLASSFVSNAGDLVIKHSKSAAAWSTAYPVGNGRLGAMPFGEYPKEKILINEETIWARGKDLKMPEDSFEQLEAVRKLEAAGDYQAADEVFKKKLLNRADVDSYQLMGYLNIEYKGGGELNKLHRQLDLKTGIATTHFHTAAGHTVTQEVYASTPDDVIVVKLSTDSAKGLDFCVSFSEAIASISGKDLQIDGQGSKRGTKFRGLVRAFPQNKVKIEGDTLILNGPKEAFLLLSASTNFDRNGSTVILPDGWQKKASTALRKLNNKSERVIRKAAVQDHSKYFSRVKVDFGKSDEQLASMTTDARLRRIRKKNMQDPDLLETYFQYGRYMLIASSRPGTFPANLQGIWNPFKKAPWSSDFHLNINLQMNYWLAETTNLGEMHTSLFDLISYYQPKGKEMAKLLGMKGWCMGHASDIWGNARLMSSQPYWGGSFFGGQWMTFHILDHYRFNRDKKALAQYWDILTDSVKFTESWLIPGPGKGQLMARPSCSPENIFTYQNKDGETIKASLSAGNSFDQYMILQVFRDYLEAADALGKSEDPYVKQIKSLVPRIYRPQVGPDGRLMEWRLPFGEAVPGHRHISHVLGAFPGNQINIDNDKKMRDAVVASIDTRLKKGGGGTGWSCAWTSGMFARFGDGDQALKYILTILRSANDKNLWYRQPYQIDSHFGSTAAMAEMLIHSHNNEIRLLPALPKQWSEGSFSGLRARGDITIDLIWKDSKVQKVVVSFGEKSKGVATLNVNGKKVVVKGTPGSSTMVGPSKLK